MPSNPCPYCALKFASKDTLQTHIRHVHRHIVQGPAGTTAGNTPETTGSQSQGGDHATQPAPVGGAATGNSNPYAPPPPQPGPMRPPPIPSPSTQTPSNHFTMIIDTRNTPLPATPTHIPITEPYTPFQDRLRSLAIPLAGHYIPNRTSGFNSNDGIWRYALIRHNGAREQPRELDRSLYYQSMISELTKAGSVFTHALVWHEVQDRGAPAPLGGSPSGGGPSTTGDEPGRSRTSGDGGSPGRGAGGQARTPEQILERRDGFGRADYLVEFVEGGMARWMSRDDLRIAGKELLADDWERSYAGSR